MTRKKNGFLTFIFSLLPGAGEMYLGFFRQGVSIMSAFFLLIAISGWLNLGPLVFVLPVIWFYSFFHVHNLASLSDEEFYAVEDKFLFAYDEKQIERFFGNGRGRKIFATVLIVVGVSALWNILMDGLHQLIWSLGMEWLQGVLSVLYDVPQVVFAIAIIVLGIHLIKGKKKELEQIEQKENATRAEYTENKVETATKKETESGNEEHTEAVE